MSTLAIVNRSADFSGDGLPNLLPAFPDLSSKLFASYLFFPTGEDPLDDLSGNGRDLATVAGATFDSAGLLAALSGSIPITPFTASQLCIDDGAVNRGCTMVGIGAIPSDLGTTISVANSGNASPYIADIADPAANTHRAYNNESGSSTPSTGLVVPANTWHATNLALFGSRHSSAYVQAAVRPHGGAWTYGSQTVTTKIPSGGQGIRLGWLSAAAAVGKTAHIAGIAFYRGLLTNSEMDQVAAMIATKLAVYGKTI